MSYFILESVMMIVVKNAIFVYLSSCTGEGLMINYQYVVTNYLPQMNFKSFVVLLLYPKQ